MCTCVRKGREWTIRSFSLPWPHVRALPSCTYLRTKYPSCSFRKKRCVVNEKRRVSHAHDICISACKTLMYFIDTGSGCDLYWCLAICFYWILTHVCCSKKDTVGAIAARSKAIYFEAVTKLTDYVLCQVLSLVSPLKCKVKHIIV